MTAMLDLRAEAAALIAPHQLAVLASAPLRTVAVPTWLARMRNEHGSARVFDGLAAQARVVGYADFAAEMATFADEERHHGALCGAVVQALGGEARIDALPALPMPTHDDASTPLEALLRNVLSVSCCSETVAVALIGAELEAMPPGPLHDLLRGIWSDEVGHARVGWRFLHMQVAQLDDDGRKALGRYAEVAIAHLVEHETAHLPVDHEPPVGGDDLGLCSGRSARELVARTVAEVIVPSLAAAGIVVS